MPLTNGPTVNQGTGGSSAWKVDGSAVTQPISAASLPLPTGASTSALQTTGNTSVGSIDTKTPALGQALAAASVPVVLTAAQITTLTPLATVAATQSGTWTVQPGNTANTTAWKVDGSAVTQPVSTTGGTPYTFASLKTTVQAVNAAATKIEGYYIFNPDSTTTWLQMFNTISAVTLGTTVPTLSFGIPAGSAANLASFKGISFGTGFKIAATTTRAGNSAPVTGLDVNFWYE